MYKSIHNTTKLKQSKINTCRKITNGSQFAVTDCYGTARYIRYMAVGTRYTR